MHEEGVMTETDTKMAAAADLAAQPLRELAFTSVPETALGLVPRVLLLPYGATAVAFAPEGGVAAVLVYRTTGMPGVTRWAVEGDKLVRDLEVTRAAPSVPLDVFVGRPGELAGRLRSMGAELEEVSRLMQRVAWRTPPGLGQTSMHHNHRLGLMADRVMTSDMGKVDITWLGLIGPLAAGTEHREVARPVMRDPGESSLRRLLASFRGEIATREP
jgi:hypothetical protein